ncbi:hypothetical protein [Neisseria animalis]|nr:hypothetical protein [Neisseria animalis]
MGKPFGGGVECMGIKGRLQNVKPRFGVMPSENPNGRRRDLLRE